MTFNHVMMTTLLDSLVKLQPELVVATTGDIHLHHPKVSSKRIIRHLDAIYTDSYLSAIDVLVLNGDVFDRRVSAESSDFTDILYWIARILRKCKRYNVRLIVIEGTRSHDHKQSELFEFINTLSDIGCDLHYINVLKVGALIEGYTAVYVPDEINHDASVTARQVQDLMAEQGLTQVDFAFMHGMFRYQLPIESAAAHNEQFYESITKHLVVINHVHNPSAKGIIRAPGSPVRLKHGEEEVKGHHCLAIKAGKVYDWFVETENNVVFKTILIKDKPIDEVYAILDDLDDLEEGSFIRLSLTRQCPSYASLRVIKSNYPHFKITEDFLDSSITTLGDGHSLVDTQVKGLVLTEDTVVDIVRTRVSSTFNDDPTALSVLEELLKGEDNE